MPMKIRRAIIEDIFYLLFIYRIDPAAYRVTAIDEHTHTHTQSLVQTYSPLYHHQPEK